MTLWITLLLSRDSGAASTWNDLYDIQIIEYLLERQLYIRWILLFVDIFTSSTFDLLPPVATHEHLDFCIVLGLLDGKYNVLPQSSCYMVRGSEKVIWRKMHHCLSCRLLIMPSNPSTNLNVYVVFWLEILMWISTWVVWFASQFVSVYSFCSC